MLQPLLSLSDSYEIFFSVTNLLERDHVQGSEFSVFLILLS